LGLSTDLPSELAWLAFELAGIDYNNSDCRQRHLRHAWQSPVVDRGLQRPDVV